MPTRSPIVDACLIFVLAATGGCDPDASAALGGDPPIEPMRWRRVGAAQFAETAPEVAQAAQAAGASIDWSELLTMSVEELARELQPVLLLDGQEYEADWADSLTLAQAVVDAQRARRDGDRQRPDAPAASGVDLRRQAVIVGDTDNRADISMSANEEPFRYLGFYDMNRSFGKENCTCNKMINHATCVMAAHCVHFGAGRKGTWKHPGKMTFRATSSSPFPEVDPANPMLSYAIVVPRGFIETNRQQWDFAVVRFRGTINAGSIDAVERPSPFTANPNVPKNYFDMGNDAYLRIADELPLDLNGVPVQQTNGEFWLAGYPLLGFEDTPLTEFPLVCGSRYPCLVYDDGPFVRRSPYRIRVLHHPMDSSLGQSGSAVLQVSGSPPTHRVVAIHNGGDTDDLGDTVGRAVVITTLVRLWLETAAGGAGTVFP